MANQRTNEFKEMTSLIQEAYGSKINIFKTILPFSVKAAESTSRNTSISNYAKTSPIAVAYDSLVDEIMEVR